MSDLWERAQLTVGGATLGLVVLGSIRKQAEKASKQQSSVVSASAPASKFLPEFLS